MTSPSTYRSRMKSCSKNAGQAANGSAAAPCGKSAKAGCITFGRDTKPSRLIRKRYRCRSWRMLYAGLDKVKYVNHASDANVASELRKGFRSVQQATVPKLQKEELHGYTQIDLRHGRSTPCGRLRVGCIHAGWVVQ